MTRYWIEGPTWSCQAWALWSSTHGFLWAFRTRAEAECARRAVARTHCFVDGVNVDVAGKLRPKTAPLFDLQRRRREQKP